jgi:two-component sensor histidine kinase
MIERTSRAPICCESRLQIQAMKLMLRETDHRIANSLQTVMALCNRTALGGDLISQHVSDQISIRICAIAHMHRMLSVSKTSGIIAFDDYLEELVNELGTLWSDRSGHRKISQCCANVRVTGEVAAQLGMIVNELVTNSCKYAYEAEKYGEVRVTFSIDNGAFVLMVADDGQGLGSRSKTGTGIGSRIVSGIATQLGAQFGYQAANPGTVAILTGPETILFAGLDLGEESQQRVKPNLVRSGIRRL